DRHRSEPAPVIVLARGRRHLAAPRARWRKAPDRHAAAAATRARRRGWSDTRAAARGPRGGPGRNRACDRNEHTERAPDDGTWCEAHRIAAGEATARAGGRPPGPVYITSGPSISTASASLKRPFIAGVSRKLISRCLIA